MMIKIKGILNTYTLMELAKDMAGVTSPAVG